MTLDLASLRAVLAQATVGLAVVQTGRYNDLHFGDCGAASGVVFDPASDGHGRGKAAFFVPSFPEELAEALAAIWNAAPELLDAAEEVELRGRDINLTRRERDAAVERCRQLETALRWCISQIDMEPTDERADDFQRARVLLAQRTENE